LRSQWSVFKSTPVEPEPRVDSGYFSNRSSLSARLAELPACPKHQKRLMKPTQLNDSCLVRHRASADEVMLDGILNQFRIGFQTEVLHDSVLVEGNGSKFEVQDIGNFLHRPPLGKQL
jgi:hypothetical protein